MLHREAFSDPEWIFERKLDGIRCLAISSDAGVRMLSRHDHDLGARYREVFEAIAGQRGHQFAVDGEVVAFARGQTSFARLAQRGQRPVAVFFYVFDLLWLDGCDTRALRLRSRKRLLRETRTFDGPLRLTPHRNTTGRSCSPRPAARAGRASSPNGRDSPYRATRSRDWLKFKCEAGQELVIGGFTAPRGSREEFGALLVGYFDAGRLSYAGKVGTGFDAETLRSLGRRLRSLRRDSSPFADPSSIREAHVTWVAPELVAQLGFTEWTGSRAPAPPTVPRPP